MSSITIPHELHKRMVEEWKREYETEFGALDAILEFPTPADWVNHYAKVVRFWTRKIPEISMTTRPSMETVCAHAIASNATENMWRTIREKKMEAEVRAALDAF